MKSLLKSTRGAMGIFSIVIDVVLVVALIPVIKAFIAGAENMTATETVILGLITLFLVLALVYNIGKQSGLIHGKK